MLGRQWGYVGDKIKKKYPKKDRTPAVGGAGDISVGTNIKKQDSLLAETTFQMPDPVLKILQAPEPSLLLSHVQPR